MSTSNSYNSLNGRQFQNSVQAIFNNLFNTSFEQEVAIPIGTPPKDHKFDLANSDRSVVVECKNYRWTKSGNVPSAKLTGLDEAVFYFNFLPKEHTKKILCIKECIHQEKHLLITLLGCTAICSAMFACLKFQITGMFIPTNYQRTEMC